MNYIYTIYSLTGGYVVQGSGVFESDSIVLNEINTFGVLDGHINLTVQVTDTEDRLIATKTTQYLKDTFYPESYYTSSNIQDQGSSSLDDFIISVIVEQQDIGGSYNLEINSVNSSATVIISGGIESSNFNLESIDFSSFDDGYLRIELVVTDLVGNQGQPQSSFYLKEDGYISYVGESLSLTFQNYDELLIYPNPTSSFWIIQSPMIIQSIELFDLIGRKVLHKQFSSKNIQINSETLPSGVYILVVNKNNTFRLLKE